MQKSNPPQAFGVFKPVGHVVISFKTSADAETAVAYLRESGFAAGEMQVYSPAEMIAQVDHDLKDASPLAAIGQEENLVKAHRALAEKGFGFVVVRAEDDAHTEKVAAAARRAGAYTAQHYGHWFIDELIDRTPGENQVFESPDRGVDVAVPGRAGG